MSEPNFHDRTAGALVAALRAELSSVWTVISGVRWSPLASFPNDGYTFDVMIVPSDAVLDWNESAHCFGPGLRPVTVIDVVCKEDCEAEFYDKPDALCLAGVNEYCLWDPTAERMRPVFQAFRRRKNVLRLVRTSTHGVFFSATGVRLDFRNGLNAGRCGEPSVEEEAFTCQKVLGAALDRAKNDQAVISALAAKAERLRAELGGTRA